jgi:Zn-dependent membrane protease YugP
VFLCYQRFHRPSSIQKNIVTHQNTSPVSQLPKQKWQFLNYHLTRQQIIACKTVLFFGVLITLGFLYQNGIKLFDISKLFSQTQLPLQDASERVATSETISLWWLFLIKSMANFDNIFINLFQSFIFSSLYLCFNLQLSFSAIILIFYFYYGELDFILYFGVVPVAFFTAFFFFKVKKSLLQSIRTYFSFLSSGSRTIKTLEFYVVCIPYMVYSVLFTITTIPNQFNFIIQLVISHLCSYFIIYKLYKKGHDIGFDYDPF